MVTFNSRPGRGVADALSVFTGTRVPIGQPTASPSLATHGGTEFEKLRTATRPFASAARPFERFDSRQLTLSRIVFIGESYAAMRCPICMLFTALDGNFADDSLNGDGFVGATGLLASRQRR